MQYKKGFTQFCLVDFQDFKCDRRLCTNDYYFFIHIARAHRNGCCSAPTVVNFGLDLHKKARWWWTRIAKSFSISSFCSSFRPLICYVIFVCGLAVKISREERGRVKLMARANFTSPSLRPSPPPRPPLSYLNCKFMQQLQKREIGERCKCSKRRFNNQSFQPRSNKRM